VLVKLLNIYFKSLGSDCIAIFREYSTVCDDVTKDYGVSVLYVGILKVVPNIWFLYLRCFLNSIVFNCSYSFRWRDISVLSREFLFEWKVPVGDKCFSYMQHSWRVLSHTHREYSRGNAASFCPPYVSLRLPFPTSVCFVPECNFLIFVTQWPTDLQFIQFAK
jgi:hypothetical protein